MKINLAFVAGYCFLFGCSSFPTHNTEKETKLDSVEWLGWGVGKRFNDGSSFTPSRCFSLCDYKGRIWIAGRGNLFPPDCHSESREVAFVECRNHNDSSVYAFRNIVTSLDAEDDFRQSLSSDMVDDWFLLLSKAANVPLPTMDFLLCMLRPIPEDAWRSYEDMISFLDAPCRQTHFQFAESREMSIPPKVEQRIKTTLPDSIRREVFHVLNGFELTISSFLSPSEFTIRDDRMMFFPVPEDDQARISRLLAELDSHAEMSLVAQSEFGHLDSIILIWYGCVDGFPITLRFVWKYEGAYNESSTGQIESESDKSVDVTFQAGHKWGVIWE